MSLPRPTIYFVVQVLDPDDPDSPWLEPVWLSQVARYLESMIQQEVPTFDEEEILQRASDELLSRPPSYFNDLLDESDHLNEFKSDVCHLTHHTIVHQCRMTGVCTKYGTTKCRFGYPRAIFQVTSFKNGVIQLKRLDTHCNNHNRALLATLRCNHDIRFITNGADAKAAVFYITDYITKSELSSYETISLIKIALEKVDLNEFGKKKQAALTIAQDNARRRVFTCLNVIDFYVERSAQWCVHGMLGHPYEYTSHKFVSFNVFLFTSYVQKVANLNAIVTNPNADNMVTDVSDTIDEVMLPTLVKDDNDDEKIVYANKRIDYTHRTDTKTNRYAVSIVTPRYLFKNDPSPSTTLAQLSPYEFHFRAEKVPKTKPRAKEKQLKKKKKKKGNDSDVTSEDDDSPETYTLNPNECALSAEHPHFESHIMKIKDVSNPKKPHLIPNMFGYILPEVTVDPEKYYLIIMSLFTPYHHDDDLLSHPNGGVYSSFEQSFKGYMSHLFVNDPIKHQWLTDLLQNMNTIREGRDQQTLERKAREAAQQEQDLVPKEAVGPYDNCDNESGASGQILSTEDEMSQIRRTIAVQHKVRIAKGSVPIISLLESAGQLHHSRHQVRSILVTRSFSYFIDDLILKLSTHTERIYARSSHSVRACSEELPRDHRYNTKGKNLLKKL